MTKTQLAQEYFPKAKPHTAVCHLMSWINCNPALLEELCQARYNSRCKTLTVRQEKIIKKHLGEP